MARIVLGDIAVVSRPASPLPWQPRPRPRWELRAVSLDEARAAATFPVRQPTHLPSPGLALARVDLLLVAAPGGSRIAQVVSRFREAPGRWLILRQIGPGEGGTTPREIGIPSAAREGRVGDRPAAYFAHPVPVAGLPGGQITVAHCLWERDGCLLELQAPHLAAGELARIGASLR